MLWSHLLLLASRKLRAQVTLRSSRDRSYLFILTAFTFAIIGDTHRADGVMVQLRPHINAGRQRHDRFEHHNLPHVSCHSAVHLC